jgi:hypothetical protein
MMHNQLETPHIASKLNASTDPVIVIMLKAICQCWAANPAERPTDQAVAIQFGDAYANMLLQSKDAHRSIYNYNYKVLSSNLH